MPTPSLGHILWYTSHGVTCEAWRMPCGSVYTGPSDNVIDCDTGHRIGRFFGPGWLTDEAVRMRLGLSSDVCPACGEVAGELGDVCAECERAAADAEAVTRETVNAVELNGGSLFNPVFQTSLF